MAFTILTIVGLILVYLLFKKPVAVARSGEPDDDHIITVDEPTGEVMERCFAWNCHVAGISHQPAQRNAEKMIAGTDWALELEREPKNEYDADAIAVMGLWKDSSGKSHRARIGYVPHETSKLIAKVAPKANLEVSLQMLIKPRPGRSPGVRMNIWSPEFSMLDFKSSRRPR